MSLPPKVVPKPAAVAVSGPGSGPSPSSQLRATLTSVSLPPGAPAAPQPGAVPPPQISRVQPTLDERIFPTQPGVAAVYSVPRHAGPPYTAHDITKGHPNLAGTPPGHAHSPALSQVSVPTASPYRYPKGWEAGGGSPYNPGQNAGSAPLVYSPQTQPMNAQPQSRPFATGPRPTHHQGGFRPIQFFQRPQMQTARPTIPTNTPSIRPGSQTPTAAVYPTNQPIMMTMAPMPFPSPQAAQYYIPQYRHSAPYVGPPQQYSVQPPGSGTFYPGPGPGEYPTPYHPLRYHPPVSPSVPAPVPTAGPPYYPGQTVYPPSPPIIVPTPQQPPPAKREKKTSSQIRIRDPNQGGRDITEEIMAGGSGSRNSTPPVGPPSSTPTPPQQQQLSGSQTPEQQQQSQPQPPQQQQAHPGGYSLESTQLSTPPQPQQQPQQSQQPQQPLTTGASDTKPGPDDTPKLEPVVQKSSSPGLVQPEAPVEKLEANAPVTEPSSVVQPELPLPAPLTTPVTLPLTVANTSERPSSRESTATASSPSPSVGEHKPSLAPPPTPNTDKPLSDAPRTLAVSPAPVPKTLNGLADPAAELDAPAHEPAPLSSAALQPQASAPAHREAASSETLPSDVRPEVPIAAALASMAPVAVVPVTLTSSPAPALPVMLPPGLPPLVQATTEADEPSKATDTKDLVSRVGTEAHGGISDSKTESQQQTLTRKSPTIVNQTTSTIPKTWRKPNEGISAGDAPQKEDEDEPRPVDQPAGDQALQSAPLSSSPVLLPPVFASSPGPAPASSPEADGKPAAPEENGETELEPMRNGAGHTSETESSDSGATPGEKENSTGAPQDMEDLAEPSGKRQYDRDFLLGFQFMPACIQKPEGLPPISDVVLDKINQNKLPSRVVDSRVISRGPDFTPAFADFGRQMTGGRGAALMNIGTRRPPPRKIIMNVSVNDDVQLKKAENAWKPGMKREGPQEDPEMQKTQELFRKVRSILNKLTPQKFNQLMKQVTDLTIDTEERLKGVIDLVFEKAIDEPSFSVAYGNMCRCLATLKVPMTDKPNQTVNFRKLLLNRCQKEFEKDKVDDVVFERKQKELDSAASVTERERLQEELEEAKDKARRRSIGNIKFIGELFKLKMLTEAIMHDCVVKLLKNHDEESLECLCRLLTTIGKDLDFEKAKPRMDQYFNQMEKIVKERKTSSRIRFMLQDVIDLRLHNWVSRRADQGPKTIEQIHKEAKIEEQEEQRKVHQQLLSKDSKRRPDPREQRVQREETWNTVPMTKNSRTIDPTKIPKISKPQMDEKIQLGPRAQVTWVKGSSGGAKASDTELSRTTGTSLNRYSALQSTPPAQPSSTPPDFDSRRSLGSSRSSTGRERNEKPLISAPSSRPGPFIRGSSSKELLETQTPEEPRRDREREGAEPRRPSVTDDKTELERSRVREPVKPEPVTQIPDRPALTEEEIERKSKSIIDEFLHINDYKEAVQCVDELDLGSQLHIFVRVGVESTLERSQITRDHMGQLLFQLVQQGTLPKAQFYKGFSDTLEQADDMAIDIPHIWLYLAELLSPVLKEGGFSMRELFSELSKPLLPVGRAGILISEILHILCKQMSHRTVGSLWRESGLNWTDILPEGEDVQTFISQQKLQFVLSDGSGPEAALSRKILSPEELSRQLERLLLEDMASDEQIFDWVEANLDESQMSSSPFLRALMTAVCKAAVKDDNTCQCRVDTAIIQRRLPVLLKYLNSDTERQLQALYALQALIVTLDQPPNLLRMFFDCLYDEDVISEDAFYKWETSKDPAEQQGKGVALKSVTAFFTWLREAEEESEDN
ncbi:eukaryotic translation initiation factor 4 gamma 3 isoform X6 [Sphaeramia orbicularis]|uniref:eukaryotic translation initiation factor 4 gamma 3 isoform X6 n=1 Tax=Sphaeramia orbicularis TaxID=375764 RepID=UPI00117E1BCE|nr:eukaryotic translation initiation factor 4 gamma 3 isoform X6 [Sphaeramia orbicularis]